MNTFDIDYAAGILDHCEPPCLSLYQTTHRHRPDNQQDTIRFGNLVKELESSLLKKCSKDALQPYLKPFLDLAEDRDFWNHTLDGLAVLHAKGIFRVYKLQHRVPELVVVADSFHTKPLMRILQSADRYQVLGLNRHEIKLFEGNRDALDEVQLHEDVPRTLTDALGEEVTDPHLTVASYGGVGASHAAAHHGHGGKKAEIDIDAERFFRLVDRGILAHHAHPSKLPLILAALPEHHHMFHEISANPFLVEDSIDIHPDSLSSLDELRARAWKLMEPRYLARLAKQAEAFKAAESEGLGKDDIAQVAKAIFEGRVAMLLIEAEREIPGKINPATGEITFDNLENPDVDDLLDDLGAFAQKMGGQVMIVPKGQMPTNTGIAAIYRY